MLRDCRECGERISDTAKSCPHCGAPKPGESAGVRAIGEIGRGLLACGCLLLLAPVFVMCGTAMCRV